MLHPVDVCLCMHFIRVFQHLFGHINNSSKYVVNTRDGISLFHYHCRSMDAHNKINGWHRQIRNVYTEDEKEDEEIKKKRNSITQIDKNPGPIYSKIESSHYIE